MATLTTGGRRPRPRLTRAKAVQYTNVNNLPEPLVRAVTNDPYRRGERTDFSVTQLLGPPRLRVLRKRHADEIVEDVSDRIYSLLGQSIHSILERAEIGDALAEERFYMKIDGLTISGQLDRAVFFKSEGLLQDYKLCSVWADDDKPEWVQQLNLLALLLKRNHWTVDKAQIVAIYRDWSKARAKRESGYPQHQARPIDVPLWSEDETVAFLRRRINLHTQAEWDLPECTPEDRWYRGEQFAVMKEGNKRATSLHDFRDHAEAEMAKLVEEAAKKAKRPKFTIEQRPGVNVRCQDYCPVSDYCEQWKSMQIAAGPKTVFDEPALAS